MDIKELKFQVWRLSEMEKKYQIEIQQLKDKLTYSEACLRSARNNEKVYRDKLHRRNMQIKDLKINFETLKSAIDKQEYYQANCLCGWSGIRIKLGISSKCPKCDARV